MKRKGYTTSVIKCAVEKDFYRLFTSDGEVSNDAEELFGIVESQSSTVFRALDAPGTFDAGLLPEDRLTLAVHIAFQFIRTREARDLANQLGDLIYRGNLELALRNKTGDALVEELTDLAGHPPTAVEVDDAKKFIADPTATRIFPSFGEVFPMMVRTAFEVAPGIAARPWTVLEAPTPTFLTSDRPVTFWRNGKKSDPYRGVGLHNADAVFFPLDSHKLLVIGEGQESGLEYRQATGSEVRRVNAIVANWSYRFIFHHPKYRPIDERRLSKTPTLIEANGRRIKPGGNLWDEIREGVLSEGKS